MQGSPALPVRQVHNVVVSVEEVLHHLVVVQSPGHVQGGLLLAVGSHQTEAQSVEGVEGREGSAPD